MRTGTKQAMSVLRVNYLKVWGGQMQGRTWNIWNSAAIFLNSSQVSYFMGVHWVDSMRKYLNIKEWPGKSVLKLFPTKIFMISTFSSWTSVLSFWSSVMAHVHHWRKTLCFQWRFFMALCSNAFGAPPSSLQHPSFQDILNEALVTLKTCQGVSPLGTVLPRTNASWRINTPASTLGGTTLFHTVSSPVGLNPSCPEWESIH